MICTPQLDWAGQYGHRAWLEPGCDPTQATIDTWPLAGPWPAGPVPGPEHYEQYRAIIQGPLTQLRVTLRPGWTDIPAAAVTADGCAAQIDVAALVDGEPVYADGVTVQGTPDYGAALLGAWIVDARCTPQPPTPTVPRIECPKGICDTVHTPPPSTSTTSTTTTSTTVAPPRPTLPETGAYTGIEVAAAAVAIVVGAALATITRKANR